MANIRVKAALEKLDTALKRVASHVRQYSGINKNEALYIDNLATDIALTAVSIAAMARAARGDRSAPKLVAKVRKALGFTYP